MVSKYLFDQYKTDVVLGQKTECPFCHKNTFSIKRDDTIGKCFHPLCGQYIALNHNEESRSNPLRPVLHDIYRDFHTALLNLKDALYENAYSYLINVRKIHETVIADSMLGAVPAKYDIDARFNPLITKLGQKAQENSSQDAQKELQTVKDAKDKLLQCINGNSGWLAFFYTDHRHNIVAIRFRKPYSKQITYFKPFKSAGLFGHGLFSPDRNTENCTFNNTMIVTEGEFNQMQLQSLLVRYNETTGKNYDYINACAVGGVNNADYDCLARVAKQPIICYDNDKSGAGYQLVEKAQNLMSVSAFTTPQDDSDLDEFILSYRDKHLEAWEALKELIENRDTYPRHYTSIAKEVFSTRQKQGQNDGRREFEINNQVADKIRTDLQDRGTFYHNHLGEYYFLNAEKKLIKLDRDYTDCAVLLDNYSINRTETIFNFIINDLKTKAHKLGEYTNSHSLAHYDKAFNRVDLFDHANKIYQITPETIRHVDNGTDGVIFLSNPKNEPFAIGQPDKSRSLFDKIFLSQINFAKDILSPDDRRILFLLWFQSLFFGSIMPTRMIMAFIGEKGSGKSITLRKVGQLLYGSNFNVTPLPNKAEDFDAAITNSHYVAIDNADSRCKWLEDRLAIVATGGTLSKRKLYTDNTTVDIPICCHMAITSRTPKFKRDDIADRLLVMRVDRFKDFQSEDVILREVLENRNELMTEVVYDIQQILRALAEYPDNDNLKTFRMADFGNFAMKIARYAGIDTHMQSIFKNMTTEQSAFTLEGDPIFDLMNLWAEENSGKEVTSAELHQELSALADSKGINFFYRDKLRSFSQRMANIKPNLSEFFVIEERQGHARQKYYKYYPKCQESQK